jgi:hypothetical protein
MFSTQLPGRPISRKVNAAPFLPGSDGETGNIWLTQTVGDLVVGVRAIGKRDGDAEGVAVVGF